MDHSPPHEDPVKGTPACSRESPPSHPQKLKEVSPVRDGGGKFARRLEHHGGVVELRHGRQQERTLTKALHAHACTEHSHDDARLLVPCRRFPRRKVADVRMRRDPLVPGLDAKRGIAHVERVDDGGHVRFVGVAVNGLGQSDCVVDKAQHATPEQHVGEGETRGDEHQRLEMVDLLPARAQPIEDPLRHAAPGLVAVVAIHDDDAEPAPAALTIVVRRVGVHDHRRAIIGLVGATPHRERRDGR
eukprot:scaffold10201_cov75-Phaeocystis_antarctica.AAC.2